MKAQTPKRGPRPKPKASANWNPSTKQSFLLGLLHRSGDVNLEEVMSASRGRAHSVRGFLLGTAKKKVDQKLVSNRMNGERRCRIADESSNVAAT